MKEHTTDCGGDTGFARKRVANELILLEFTIKNFQGGWDPLTEADKRNGFEYKGSLWLAEGAFRYYDEKNGWGEWQQLPAPMSGKNAPFVQEYRIEKKQGEWTVFPAAKEEPSLYRQFQQGMIEFERETLDCDKIPQR
jgi:hypothetical protein